jgi:hypothetical protein
MRNEINLDSIDWKMFKKQKEMLIRLAATSNKHGFLKQEEALDGVINLLDYIQDCHDMEPGLFVRMYPGWPKIKKEKKNEKRA